MQLIDKKDTRQKQCAVLKKLQFNYLFTFISIYDMSK